MLSDVKEMLFVILRQNNFLACPKNFSCSKNIFLTARKKILCEEINLAVRKKWVVSFSRKIFLASEIISISGSIKSFFPRYRVILCIVSPVYERICSDSVNFLPQKKILKQRF